MKFIIKIHGDGIPHTITRSSIIDVADVLYTEGFADPKEIETIVKQLTDQIHHIHIGIESKYQYQIAITLEPTT